MWLRLISAVTIGMFSLLFLVPTGDLFTEAAEAAMEAMKGRLANQYYMKAEEAWALIEEEEEE